MNRKHPATYSRKVLDCVGPILQAEAEARGSISMLDPMAGVGKCFLLETDRIRFTAIDLDPDFEDTDPRVMRANALHLPFPDGSFTGIFVSPVYGNRMGDHHEARDPCSQCAGAGCEAQCGDFGGCKMVYAGPDSHKVCAKCKGSGLSPRNTYFHRLGRMPSPGSSCLMQWEGEGIAEYKRFHVAAWTEASRVAQDLFVLNVSNHIRKHEEQFVAEWHRDALVVLGWDLTDVREVNTPRNRYGANGEIRVAHEYVMVLRR